MIRWIIGSSLRFRLLVVGIAAGVMVARHHAASQRRRWTSCPSSRRRTSRSRPRRSGFPRRRSSSSSPSRSRQTSSTGPRASRCCAPSPCGACLRSRFCSSRGRPSRTPASSCRSSSPRRTRTRTCRRRRQMLQPVSSESRVMIIGLSSSKLTPIQQSVLARWTIRPQLMGVDGVANVSIFGLRDKQLQVLVESRSAEGQGRHPEPGDQDGRQRAARVAAQLPRGVDAGYRRLHRHAEPAAPGPAHPAHGDAEQLARCRSKARPEPAGLRGGRGTAAPRRNGKRCASATSATWSRATRR